MQSNQFELVKIRDFGEVLNASFQFLKNERKLLGTLLLYFFVPFLIIFSAIQSYTQSQIMGFMSNVDPENIFDSYMSLLSNPIIILNYLFSILIITMLLGILYSYIEVYQNKGQGNFTLSDITPVLFKNSAKALLAAIVTGIITFLGLILCFLPGIFLANSFSLVAIIFIIEKNGLKESMSRSWNLVMTQWWRTLLINIIGGLIVVMISYIISLPLTIAMATSTILSANSGAEVDVPTWYFIIQGIISMLTTALYIIPFTFIALQYFNLIESEERPSLLKKIEALEKNED